MSDQLYKSIDLTTDEVARLTALNEKRTSLAAFVEQVTLAGERRNAELMTQGRELWVELGKKYSLDLDHVAYDFDGKQLKPLQVRLT